MNGIRRVLHAKEERLPTSIDTQKASETEEMVCVAAMLTLEGQRFWFIDI